MLALILFLGFLFFLLIGVPVSISIGAAVLAAFLTSNFADAIYIIPQQLLEGIRNPALLAVPFFIMAGNLMNAVGMTDRIFNFANNLVGHYKAGLAQVNVLASMVFSGVSGAAVADCAGLGAVEIKAMKKRGYRADFAAALTVCSAVIGPIIPPSIGLVIYSFLSEQSVERMFLAGIIPGIIVGIGLMIFNRWYANIYNFPIQKKASRRETIQSGFDGILALVAPAIILSGIIFGFVTATEAGVLACIYTLILGFIYKSINIRNFYNAMKETMIMTSIIMIIIGFSMSMGWLLAIDQIPQMLGDYLFSFTDNKYYFILLVIIFLILIGCVVNGVPASLILVPMLLPIVDQYEISRIHFGIIMELSLLIGIATPPMGIGLYIVSEVGDVPFEKVSVAVLPLLIPLISVLLLIAFFPALTLWLPNQILGN